MNNINLKSSSRLKKIFCFFLLAVLMAYNSVALATSNDKTTDENENEKKQFTEKERDTKVKAELAKHWDTYWVIGLGVALALALCLVAFLLFTRKNEDQE